MAAAFLRLQDYRLLPSFLRGAVIAIGNFDGVHKGHQTVLYAALEQAKLMHKPAIILTFEPHPRSFFHSLEPVKRLTSADEKAKIFRFMGFDAVIEQRFTEEFAALRAEDFVKKMLFEMLQVHHVVIGENYHFGYQRAGDAPGLKKMSEPYSINVTIMAGLRDQNGKMISSSRIRHLLCKGDVTEAANLLGYHYRVSGKIIHGAALGRTLGFPTANMALNKDQNPLLPAIYAVKFHRADGQIYDGVASFGYRPTVNCLTQPLLETFIFDFSDNLYDEIGSVSFISYLREEIKFLSLDSLVIQMHKDEANARYDLNKAKILSDIDNELTFR